MNGREAKARHLQSERGHTRRFPIGRRKAQERGAFAVEVRVRDRVRRPCPADAATFDFVAQEGTHRVGNDVPGREQELLREMGVLGRRTVAELSPFHPTHVILPTMKNAKHDHRAALDEVEDLVRKAREEGAANVTIAFRMAIRSLLQLGHRGSRFAVSPLRTA